MNALTGLGEEGYERAQSTVVGTRCRLHKADLEELATNWICRNIVETMPREATRKWLTISFGKEGDTDEIADYEDYETRLKVREKFFYAQYLANLYRGAAIVIVADDGQEASQPLKSKNLRSIRKLEVLDCHKIYPEISSFNADPNDPEYYRLVIDAARYPSLKGMNTLVHHSRVIRFDGVLQPPDVMLQNTPAGWGASWLEVVYEAFVDYESVHRSVAEMAQSFNVFKMAMQGLSNALKAGGEANADLLRTRFRAMQMMMSVFKGIIVDADKESVEFISRNFSGIADVMDRFTNRLVGATGLPYTILFGRGPQGLASTGAGDTEEASWAKKVEQFQEIQFRPRYQRLAKLIWRAQDGPTGGKTPEDWDFQFNPLLEEDRKLEMDVRSIAANTYQTYVTMGALLPEEVRQSQFSGSEYSIEITLDDALWQEKQQEQLGGFGGDFGGFGDPSGSGDFGGFGAEPAPSSPAEPAPTEPQIQKDSWRADTWGDVELYQRSQQQAGVRFPLGGYHADHWAMNNYLHLYRQKHGSVKGAFAVNHEDSLEPSEEWVWIRPSGKIQTQRDDSLRRLPRSRAEALSIAERKAISLTGRRSYGR